jgi:soluble lytic murein transglycosylase
MALILSTAQAQVIELKLKQSKGLKAKAESSKSLKKLKELENSKDWSECLQLGPSVYEQEVSLRGWVMNTWLVCARQSLKEGKSAGPLTAALGKLEKNRILVFESSARKVLQEEVWRSRSSLIEASLKGATKAEQEVADRQIQALWDLGVSREEKAKLLAWSGELAQLRHQQGAAEALLQQSIDLVEVKAVRDRLNALQFALNTKKSENSDVPLGPEKSLSDSEAMFEERFRVSLKNNDLIAFVEDATAYLNQFPNGRRTKWASEKIMDIYQNFSDKASEEKFASLRDKVLSQWDKLDSSRALEFARVLHRRGDFAGSLRLAERGLTGLSQSSQASVLNYIAGRSAQFSGDYKKARKYFENYLEFHSAGEDVGEVSFRLALVHMREENYSSSIAVLEKLLLSKAGEKFELGSRYWLVRALQATRNDRAAKEQLRLIEKFPFSYYGLRLKSEMQGLQLDPLPRLAEIEKAESVAFLTPFQKQIWDRALRLSSHGWVAEAFIEISEMTFSMPPLAKVLIAESLVKHGIHWTAIRLTNEAMDSDPQLRSADVLSLGFPSSYEKAIQVQADRFRLSPWLVKSLIRQESAFNERATSVSKAMGLMQLIPPTAAEVATDLGLVGLDLPEDSYLPEVNLQMGTYYIARMIKQFGGNVPLGLAAYNAGPTRMQLFLKARPEVQEMLTKFSSEPADEIWIDELPWSETSFYVKAILRNTILYRLLILKEGAPALKLERVVWQDLAPDLKPQIRLDVSPDSGPAANP